MGKNYKLIQKVVNNGKYKVLEDDGEHIIIKYQLNTIHICPSSEDDRFVSILLSDFADVTDENFPDVVMRCHKLNETMKQVKFYTVSDVLIAGAEFFYMEEEDLAYQINIALNSLLAAKFNYRKLER